MICFSSDKGASTKSLAKSGQNTSYMYMYYAHKKRLAEVHLIVALQSSVL